MQTIRLNDTTILEVENLSDQFFKHDSPGLNSVDGRFELVDPTVQDLLERLNDAAKACGPNEILILDYMARHSLSIWNIAMSNKEAHPEVVDELAQQHDHPLHAQGIERALQRQAAFAKELQAGMPRPALRVVTTLRRTMESDLLFFGEAEKGEKVMAIENYRELAFADATDFRSDISTLRELYPHVIFKNDLSDKDDFRKRYPDTAHAFEEWQAFLARVTRGMGEWWREIKNTVELKKASPETDNDKGPHIVISTTTHRIVVRGLHELLFGIKDKEFDQAQIKPYVYKIREITVEASVV